MTKHNQKLKLERHSSPVRERLAVPTRLSTVNLQHEPAQFEFVFAMPAAHYERPSKYLSKCPLPQTEKSCLQPTALLWNMADSCGRYGEV
jgi:hypothetical protein